MQSESLYGIPTIQVDFDLVTIERSSLLWINTDIFLYYITAVFHTLVNIVALTYLLNLLCKFI